MTLLEVLLAVLLLSLTIAAVMTAVSSLAGMESNGRKRLAAHEIANRLILMYLDDEDSLPSKASPLTYGNHRFFWDLGETGATMVINRKQERNGANLQALDRFKLIEVVVYETEGEVGSEVQGEPIAALSRVIDPAAPRNPDSLETFSNVDKISGLIRIITGQSTLKTSGDSGRSGRKLR